MNSKIKKTGTLSFVFIPVLCPFMRQAHGSLWRKPLRGAVTESGSLGGIPASPLRTQPARASVPSSAKWGYQQTLHYRMVVRVGWGSAVPGRQTSVTAKGHGSCLSHTAVCPFDAYCSVVLRAVLEVMGVSVHGSSTRNRSEVSK